MARNFFRKGMGLVAIVSAFMGGAVILGNGVPFPQSQVLEINVENITTYIGDSDFSKLASKPDLTPTGPKSFSTLIGLGDIVAVNGRPARGTWSVFTALALMAPIPIPGFAISDTFRGGVAVTQFEILDSDGAPRGTIMAQGLAGGPAPPGSGAFGLRFGNLAITGGTGEFVGARGVSGETTNPIEGFRFASSSEDPSKRRVLGGGKLTFVASIVR